MESVSETDILSSLSKYNAREKGVEDNPSRDGVS
jgi:hypothetical protein